MVSKVLSYINHVSFTGALMIGMLLQGCGTTATNDIASSSTTGQQSMSSSSVAASVTDYDGATSSLSAEPLALEVTNGLLLHLDANELATIFDDGDAVDYWPSINANGSANQTVPTKRPVWVASAINQLPAVRFDGVDDYLALDQHYFSNNLVEGTAFIVAKPTTSQAEILGAETTSQIALTQSGFGFGIANDKVFFKAKSDGDGLWTLSAPAIDSAKARVVAARYSAEQLSLFTECEQLNHLGVSEPMIGSLSALGGNAGGVNSLKGDVAEVILYDRPLSTAEVASVRAFLADKYSLDIAPISNGKMAKCTAAPTLIPAAQQAITVETPAALFAGSEANISNLTSVTDPDPHTTSSHVWVKGEFTMLFEFESAKTVKALHFWNFYDDEYNNTEKFDVDSLKATFMSEDGTVLHELDVMPKSGFGEIYAEDFVVNVSNVKRVRVVVSGSNGEGEFQNIAFSTTQ